MPEENLTLYAGWSVNQYTLSFDSKGGSNVSAISQDFLTPVTEPSPPERLGYTFTGWFVDEGLQTEYTFTTMPEENLTLYAGWSVNQYNVRFYIYDNFNPSAHLTYGSPFYLYSGETIVSVSLGNGHASALTSKGRLYMWGSSQSGQIGSGEWPPRIRFTPVEITSQFNLNAGEEFINVALWGHSSALTSEGRVFEWGKSMILSPHEITSQFNLNPGETVVKISLGGGGGRSSALTSEGRLFMWGLNSGVYSGLLGDGTTIDRPFPTEIT
jgi:uncharacterized repeat protein (TIGR02543 family)